MHDTYTTIWKPEHLEKVAGSVPEAVKTEILAVIQTLNQHYGEDRDVDGDLGGYLVVFPEPHSREAYEALLSRYHLREQDREHTDLLCGAGNALWVKELFLCGSDYHLVIINPVIL